MTGLRFANGDVNVLFTCSLDGTVKRWDIRTGAAIMTINIGRSESCLFPSRYHRAHASLPRVTLCSPIIHELVIFWLSPDCAVLGVFPLHCVCCREYVCARLHGLLM